ncbi:UNVERIFIED_ORG: hypothetical protein J2W65_003805 [Pseudomonas parafulva]|uniref:hypothetical protein n=1 Tax=Pseudomonas TaxID=286 RepID=UPI000B507B84|nr:MULTISPECIES: hypothetical protein [Pseudomonas]MDP9558151.1 hypothetical protein [Pseudomonas parafulva]MBA1208847.1 hypothetical protein [Pseudomonas fulva]MBA1217976.1 hypothetical protein [Pseudomonas fulva]MDH0573441.1 hypothetical protein [Pseudomonas fulva]QDC04025.1 hypothetical protein FH041_03305 [Pseudomonas sp. SWI7]
MPIDRVTTLTYVALSAASTKRNSAVYLRQVMQAFTSKIYTALTDNGEAFTEQPRCRNGAANRSGGSILNRVCHERVIKHRLTKT